MTYERSKKEKFLSLVSKEKTNTLERSRERIKNRAMLRESRQIALEILKRLDKLEWTQKDLAKKMEVSPQQVNKIVRGKENLTLGTIVKLQEILEIPILNSCKHKENITIELIMEQDQTHEKGNIQPSYKVAYVDNKRQIPVRNYSQALA